MLKTTVYLDEQEAAALRRLSAQTGRSQAQIIREAVAAATAQAGPRRFASHGAGHGDGSPGGRQADAILRREFPRDER